MMDLGQILGLGSAIGGGLLTKEAYDRLSSIGNQSLVGFTTDSGVKVPGTMGLAEESLGLSQFKPFTVTTTTGGTFDVGTTVDPVTGAVTGTDVEGNLSYLERDLQNQLFYTAQDQLLKGSPGGPIIPGVIPAEEAGRALMTRGREQLTQDPLLAQDASNLGSMFMGQLAQPMAGRETDIYNRIRATQTPEEQRQRLALEERLASQGRLGVQTAMYGGTPEQFALAQAQEEAQNRASLAAIQQAQAEQQQQAALGAQFAGLGSSLTDAQQQRALQSLTSGQGLFASGLGLQQGQQQLGLGALSGAYVPQAQLLNVQQASQIYPQMQQQAQLYGAGQYGETMMSGLEARLIAEQARANLLGGVGTGLLGGLLSPVGSAESGYVTPLVELLEGL